MANEALTPRERNLAVGNLVSFLATLTINGLGSAGVITGNDVGGVSDSYPTKFTPASSAFTIWSLIYFGIAVYITMQFIPSTGFFGLRSEESRKTLFVDIGIWFMLSCAVNCTWIVLFVFQTPVTTWLSVPFLFGLLVCLTVIAEKCQFWRRKRNSVMEVIFLDGIFSIYCGWATVASVVNVTAACVSVGWNGAPWTAAGWSVLMMVIAAVINILIIVLRNNSVWALVYTWGVYWIAVANADDQVVNTAGIVMASLVGVIAVANIVRNVVTGSKVPIEHAEEAQALEVGKV